jgi:hypothetical protein
MPARKALYAKHLAEQFKSMESFAPLVVFA